MRDARYIKAAIAVLLALAVASCGYGVRPGPTIDSIAIGRIDNRSHEPRLGDDLRAALIMELAARGVRVNQDMEAYVITGAIESLEVKPLAVRGSSLVKFSVSLKGRFVLIDPRENEREIRTPLSYMIAFGSDVPLDSLYAMRHEAVRQAVSDLASDLASAVAYSR